MMNINDDPALDPPVFDGDDFLERMDGDMDLLKEVIGIFLEDAPNLLSALDSAVRAGDVEATEKAAHTLKGAAANISAKRLQYSAHIMQEAIKNGRMGAAEKLVMEMEAQYELLEQALQSHLSAKK